ncbi:MAG TPA: FAD-dependent monooxygenase [Polyangiaceae bacterium]|nr:FAD-dependent monooxygenase [Polyangiaceae bacterium]
MPPLDGNVLIIGAGIGGLTLARALVRRGIPCEIFEREAELKPVGAGILVQTGAMLALRTLGLDGPVARAGQEARVGFLTTDRGVTLQTTPMDFLREELGAPTVAIHRGSLQEVLLRGAEGVHLTRAAELTRYAADAGGVTAHFADGRSARGALLVGADGLRSAVRRELLGDSPLRYAGYTSWRGISDAGAALTPHEVREMWGPGSRFGFAGIGDGAAYWFAVVNAPAGGRDADSLAVVRERFASWAAPVPALLAATRPERVFRTDIHDREPVRAWSKGRVTLLGDAAHPTTPNLGQGGCMAIEDAVVLAHALEHANTLDDALADYERKRLERTSRIVRVSFRFGQIAQLENPSLIWLRNALLRFTPVAGVQRQLRAAANFSLDPA